MIATLLALLAAVNISNPSVSYACDGVTAVYAVTFPYIASTDLVTTTTTAGGVTTTLTQVTDYSVNLSSTSTTATLTVNVPATKCPAGNTLKIARVVSYTQPYSFRAQTTYKQELHETAYDRIVMQIQQLATILPTAAALGLQEEGVALGNINTLNCVGPGLTCTALAGVGSATTSTAAPTTVPNSGNTNSAGTADSLSRSDHVHALAVGPMLDVANNTPQTITAGAGATIVQFQTVTRDTDSAFNAGTWRYTVPTGKGGDYQVSSAVNITTGAATTGVLLSIYKGGTEIKRLYQQNSAHANADVRALGTSTTVNFAAGDVIDIRISCATNNVTVNSNTGVTFFSLKRIQ